MSATFETVAGIISETCDIPREKITPQSHAIDDLGIDSLAFLKTVVDEELSYYESAAAYYLSTRPGLTGLWQISGRNDVSYKTRVAFDTQYVQNWSMRQDVFIIVKTIPAVCLSRGSY